MIKKIKIYSTVFEVGRNGVKSIKMSERVMDEIITSYGPTEKHIYRTVDVLGEDGKLIYQASTYNHYLEIYYA